MKKEMLINQPSIYDLLVEFNPNDIEVKISQACDNGYRDEVVIELERLPELIAALQNILTLKK